MNSIHLEKLIWDTVDDVLKLKVAKEQKSFVAPNRDSMIDAYFALTEEKNLCSRSAFISAKSPSVFL